MIIPLLIAASLLGVRPKAPVAPPAPQRERGIVMPVDVAADAARHVSSDQRRRLETDIASILQRYRRLNVMTYRDLKDLANMDAERQVSGCDTSCASELAAAAGARFVFAPRIEIGPMGLLLTIALVDADNAHILARGRAQGARVRDFSPQLPFAVDDAAQSLRSPGDPTPADILNEARAKLAVLPIRTKNAEALPKNAVQIVDDAADRVADRLGLRALDNEGFLALATGRGCTVGDLGCALPAAAANGTALALGVSVVDDGARRVVWASLLTPDGAVVARADRAIDGADGAAFTAAVARAVDDVVDVRLKGKAATGADNVDSTTVLADLPCNIMRGIEGVGSRCLLYKDRLVITPHAFNIQAQAETIVLGDVVRVEAFNPMGIAPSGIRFSMKDRSVRDLIVGIGPRERVLAQLQPLVGGG